MKLFLNASEFAKLLNVNRATIIRWINTGIVKGAAQSNKSKQWRIPLSSYQELLKVKHESH
jgi:predicted site-specific integrase-resolvase